MGFTGPAQPRIQRAIAGHGAPAAQWCMHIHRLVLILILLAPAGRAEQYLHPQPGTAMSANARLDYSAYVAGLNIINLQVGLDLTPGRYTLALHHVTAGAFGLMFAGDIRSKAEGTWQGNAPMPRRFVSAGLWRGEDHRTEIEYLNGNPQIRSLVPAEVDARDPVPEAMRRATVDSLSAVAMLIHSVATSGSCDGQVTTFDGRRVVTSTARTVGPESLPVESRSSFSGSTLRCDFDGLEIAGFPRDVDPVVARRIQHAVVWFAPVLPNQPPLPVLMQFETRFLGHVTLYLTHSAANALVAELTPP